MRNNKSSKIWLSPPHKSGYEQDFLNEALESNYIAPIGPFIEKFENSLKSYTNSLFAVALNSGTSAIHLALKCIEIKQNDVVFCSTFTFIATANPILYENAIPYFIESEKETWNMCPIFLEKAILKTIANKQKPAAIILVHLYGNPAKFNEIKPIALKYNIPIIEDAAEALGSTYNNIPCGSLSDLGIISFNGNKIITTSGGGALLTSNEEYAKQVKYLSTQAKEAVLHYEHKAIGFNYRMSNIAAAIGCAQMKVISERVIKRRENFNLYKTLFSNTSISFQNELELSFSNRWLTSIILKNSTVKGKVLNELLENNIECRPLWKPLHSQPIFENCFYEGDNYSNDLFQKGLCLPSGTELTQENIELISNLVLKNI